MPLDGESVAHLLTEARWARDHADWRRLAEIDTSQIEEAHAVAELELLGAIGCGVIGDLGEAGRRLERALDLGCPPELAARHMVSATLATLGGAAVLLGDELRARRHYERASEIAGGAAAVAHETRAKVAGSRLLEAGELLATELARLTSQQAVTTTEAATLRAQIELLNHALVLAQTRGQLEGQRRQGGAHSQLGQDLWVVDRTRGKRGGFFVEVGASDGVLLSNTYLLETEFGWSGICVEPNPRFFDRLVLNRSCSCSPSCVSDVTGRRVDFVLAEEYGTILDHLTDDGHADRRQAFLEAGDVIQLETVSLDDLLRQHEAPRTIDYISIDTEGSEYEILSTFPFDEWDVRLLTIEHNFTPMRERVHGLLEGHGYLRTAREWDDWYERGRPS